MQLWLPSREMSVRELVMPDGRTQMALDQDYRLFDISGAGEQLGSKLPELEITSRSGSYL